MRAALLLLPLCVAASVFEVDRTRSSVWFLVGVATTVAALTALHERDDRYFFDTGVTDAALIIGAVAPTYIGAHFSIRAERELAHTIWWYNRDLAPR